MTTCLNNKEVTKKALPVMVVVLQEVPASPLDMAETRESPGATRSGLNLK